jgi:ATP-dependent helicase YprA (DUF1998 family)
MKTIKMANYAIDGDLSDTEDARFFARKFDADTCLDFTGVVSVSAEFLEILLAGQVPESLEGRLVGITELVDQELVKWLNRKDPTAIQPEKPTSIPRVVKPRKSVPSALSFNRPDTDGERFTPSRLVTRLRKQLTSYIESAYPLSDPVLVRTRRNLLKQDQDGHLLAQEPYVETTPRYKTHKGDYGSLGLPAHVAELFSRFSNAKQQFSKPTEDKTILFPNMYLHQAESYRQFLNEGKDIVVATGTGSGKTECFLIPLLGKLYDEACSRPKSFSNPGVRALILYPMNALVNDQLSRLRLMFGDMGVANAFPEIDGHPRFPTFGVYTGRTHYPGPRTAAKDGERVKPLIKYYLNLALEVRNQLQRLGRYPAKDLTKFLASHLEEEKVYLSGKRKGQKYISHNWEKRLHTHPLDRELLTRHEMVAGSGSLPGRSPDILVTNYSMLEYMLMRPFERPLFQQTSEWLAGQDNQFLLVLDEAHTYRGAKGAEVAFLIRRLRARLGINDRPDKLRVICTSASLGTGTESLENIRRFAADLTSKSPDDFVAITGERDVPEMAKPGSAELADILANIDLEEIHKPGAAKALATQLAPLFEHLNRVSAATDESEILRDLYDALKDQPFMNLLLRETAGEARSLKQLSGRLFPSHSRGQKAAEVLVTLGTLARRQQDDPGLIPTRIHSVYRSLQALYACINPSCSGRQDSPGQPAVLGKMFAEPRISCDVCNARVFELASCRNCGSPYLLAYYPDNQLDQLQFLWGETEGDLEKIQMLPLHPRYDEATEEIRIHISTGYVDRKNSFPEDEVRPIWIPLDDDGNRISEFKKCALCQPPGSRGSTSITDFRTKGEQPFTVLVEAQFAEQPPQKDDKQLPNRGRKVLVFSDGRQKAARLAPSMEHTHARDLFRQVICIATDSVKNQEQFLGMDKLYPAIVYSCNHRGVDLFPDPSEVEFHDQLRRCSGKNLVQLISDYNRGYLRPTQSYAQLLFSEMTDRYYSLNALALATIEEDPLVRSCLDSFPQIGLSRDDISALFRTWLRFQLEARRFLPEGADISKLGEGWERPDGIDATNAINVIPRAFGNYLRKILDESRCSKVEQWFPEFIRRSGLLRLENDRYFLQPTGLRVVLRVDAPWLRCSDCSRLFAEVLGGICPYCMGSVAEADPDYLDARTGFYREQLMRALDETCIEPFGLTAAEHSAQLTGMEEEEAFNRTERYEMRFQDISLDGEPPIDILSCTTTMEVGIDIGTLCGVALRNVPPHVSNYQQRAGRAGRRGRSVASVITYAHGTSHDSYFYQHPERIISGDVLPPVVYVQNQKVLQRHINAYLIQRFFHETVAANSEVYQLFTSMGTVEQFLSDKFPCSLTKFEKWVREKRLRLKEEIRLWAPKFSHAENKEIPGINATIDGSIDTLISILNTNLPVLDFPRREQLTGIEREVLERQLAENLLETLIGRAIFPRYAFPIDVVNLWIAKRKLPGDALYKRTFEYQPQRDLQIALSEYAPGSTLTIDKYRFTSAALYSPYAPDVTTLLQKTHAYCACGICGYVSLDEMAFGLACCPICNNSELFKKHFLIPEGFASDINEKREVDRGDAQTVAGRTSRAQLEVQEPPATWDDHLYDQRVSIIARAQNLVMVNKGIGNRGFLVCPSCGRTEPVFGPGFTEPKLMKNGVPIQHQHPIEQGQLCQQTAVGPFFLGHKFPTDVLLLRLKFREPVICPIGDTPFRTGQAGRAALTSLVEAMCMAAARTLQIDEGELAGNWSPVMGGGDNQVFMFLYDLLPGGAGYTRQVKNNLDKVFAETKSLLEGCDCETSCYRCLRHYGNNLLHTSLDRHLALAIIDHLIFGKEPSLTPLQQKTALAGLIEVLKLQNIDYAIDVKKSNITVPLIAKRSDGSEIWVDVQHSLVDADAKLSAIRSNAEIALAEYCSLDTFTLHHNLPAAFAALRV